KREITTPAGNESAPRVDQEDVGKQHDHCRQHDPHPVDGEGRQPPGGRAPLSPQCIYRSPNYCRSENPLRCDEELTPGARQLLSYRYRRNAELPTPAQTSTTN